MEPLRSRRVVNRDAASALSATVADARGAWLRADFSACVTALEPLGLRKGDTAERADGILLHARALLRSHRASDAKELLGPTKGTFCTIDAECTAHMLYAVAVTLCDSADAGLSLLHEASDLCDRLGAHHAIRTEVDYYSGIAHWAKRQLPMAARFARAVEASRLDVLSVRGTQLLGFVAIAEERYADALLTFKSALAAFRMCRERDTDLMEQVIVQIATLEAQLRSSSVAGSYLSPQSRRVSGDVFRATTSVGRCQVAWLDAWQHAHDGNVRAALHCMRDAQSVAPAPPWMVFALAGRSLISAAFGETGNAHEHASHAVSIAEKVDWQKSRGEERFALIFLAEALASLEPDQAARILARFDTITTKVDDVQFAGTDPRKSALESYVRGLVARGLGDARNARTMLDEASRGFQACGHLWRAALSLIELDATLVPATTRVECSLDAAAKIVRANFPRSFLAGRLGRWGIAFNDPVAARLTPAQRQVLRYALDGYGAKEIASVTGRSVKTIGNQMAAIHEAFGVNTTLRLIAECHRRGLGTPSWRDFSKATAAERSAGIVAR